MSGTIRLYVDHPLGQGQTIPLAREQAHYLFGVMRLGAGAELLLFNGADGEWRAEVLEAGKRGGVLRCVAQTRPQAGPPDLWLLFAPVKKARTDFIVEKAKRAALRPLQASSPWRRGLLVPGRCWSAPKAGFRRQSANGCTRWTTPMRWPWGRVSFGRKRRRWRR